MGHDHEELLEANLHEGACLLLMLVPFIEEGFNNLLSYWIVGERWYAVQVLSAYRLFVFTQLLESFVKVLNLLQRKSCFIRQVLVFMPGVRLGL